MAVDLDKLIADHKYEVEIVPPEQALDADLRRTKELWLFMVALALVVCFTITLLLWLIWGTPSAEDKKWIFALLGSAFGVASTVLLKK
jgi:uncharacterized BrkB/YihY/UPF0761 family membrane protein